jgi:glycine cleavage system aminomethyltransferase T
MKHSPLLRAHQKAGAELGERDGWLVPLRYNLSRNSETAGLADWSWINKLDLQGVVKAAPPDGIRLLPLGGRHALVLCEPTSRAAADAWIAQEQLSVTDVTGGYACFLLVGSSGRDILAKLTSADLRESQTSIAHAPGIVLRTVLGYQILVPRDYAESVWESLLHAGEEFHLTPMGVEEVSPL